MKISCKHIFLLIVGLFVLNLLIMVQNRDAGARAKYDPSGYWIAPILPDGPRILFSEGHVIDTPEAVNATITDIYINNNAEIKVTFVIPGYEHDTAHVELTMAKWLEDENTWMSMLQRTRERGPQGDPRYGDGAKVIRGANLRLENGTALTGGEPVSGGMRFSTWFKSGPGDFGNLSGELTPISFSDGVKWRRSSDHNPASYGDPEDFQYHQFAADIIDQINRNGAWESGIYRIGVTERNRGQEGYLRFNAVADFYFDGNNEVRILDSNERKHTAGEAVAMGSCNRCHGDDMRFPTNRVHSELRHDPTVCANCHNAYTWDSRNAYAEVDGWPSLDLRTMVHKIHAGIEGYAADAYFYQQVRFPDWTFGRTPRPSQARPYPNSPGVANCTSCHVYSGEEVYSWQRQNPDPQGCSTCHGEGGMVFWQAEPGDPDYEFISATYDCGHNCASCHGEQRPFKHTPDHYHNVTEQLERLALARSHVMEVTRVENAVAGQRPVVTWRVREGDQYLDLFSGKQGSFLFKEDKELFEEGEAVRLGIGWGYGEDWTNQGVGPRSTGAIGDPFHEIAHIDNTVPGDDQTTAVTTFDSPLPETAFSGRSGFVIIEFGPEEIQLNSRLKRISLGQGPNSFLDDRRLIVDAESCLSCHATMGRHGTYADQDISSCVSCHNAGSMSRDASAVQGSVDFMYMIHGIHGTGEKRKSFDRRRDHTVDGHFIGGYSYVSYPNTILDCTACHVNDSHNPVGKDFKRLGLIADNARDMFLAGAGVAAPLSSVCYSCHEDTQSMRVNKELQHHFYHSGGNIYGEHDHAYFTDNREQCLTCHQE
ncbi:multiheme c-type cytochrome [Desulfonatronovibrio magnus]|uniref:multiheme c-type cytochrome n=1 Tax=Desulfonatronovibrio magnus TaxID=698827 RepID=UPI0005EB4BC3|nr:hypothetical protein [Desulfonatronovibrio magnus]